MQRVVTIIQFGRVRRVVDAVLAVANTVYVATWDTIIDGMARVLGCDTL